MHAASHLRLEGELGRGEAVGGGEPRRLLGAEREGDGGRPALLRHGGDEARGHGDELLLARGREEGEEPGREEVEQPEGREDRADAVVVVLHRHELGALVGEDHLQHGHDAAGVLVLLERPRQADGARDHGRARGVEVEVGVGHLGLRVHHVHGVPVAGGGGAPRDAAATTVTRQGMSTSRE